MELINKIPLTVNGDCNQRRDFTYVGDVVRANIRAAKSKNVGKGEVINIGNGENISINELAENIGGEVVFNEPLNEPFANLADIKKAKKLLDWEPTTDLISWIKNYKKTKGLK